MRPTHRRRLRQLFLLSCAAAALAMVGMGVYGLVGWVKGKISPDDGIAVEAPAKPMETCGCTRHSVRFKRDHYDKHRLHAKALNKHTLVTETGLAASPLLTEVNDGTGYRIDRHKLTHSVPYLNRKAYTALQDMGRVYADKVRGTDAEGSAFHISSLTRTVEQQAKLRRSPAGKNATPNVSAHSYGASFDIYKLGNTNSCALARKAFEEVLVEFQKAGRILLCPEGNCIHVTVKG